MPLVIHLNHKLLYTECLWLLSHIGRKDENMNYDLRTWNFYYKNRGNKSASTYLLIADAYKEKALEFKLRFG